MSQSSNWRIVIRLITCEKLWSIPAADGVEQVSKFRLLDPHSDVDYTTDKNTHDYEGVYVENDPNDNR